MAQTILYYPQIDIRDGAWLRNAVLYWNEVSSIVPYENYEYFSPELLYLQNMGVYHAVYPQDLFYSDFAEEFCDTIVKRISEYEESVNKSSLRINAKTVRIHKDKIYSPALYELLHYKKLTQSLLEVFKEKQLIHDYNTDGWLEIDRRIAQIYMRTLAEYSIKCSGQDIVLGTDTVPSNREIYRSVPCIHNTQTQCCNININNCLPQPSLNVGFEEILDFKSRRKDELNAFRSKIRELETNIYRAESPEEIKHCEAHFKESWEHCSDDYYRVLKESKIQFLLGSLVSIVATPFVEQLLLQRIGQEPSTVLQASASLINIGICYHDYQNKISPAKSDGGFSYIIKANRDGIIQI